MITLNYAQLNQDYSEFNIPKMKFKNINDIIDFLNELQSYDKKDTVYIFGTCLDNEIDEELFIHHNVKPFINHLKQHKIRNKERFFLQEYESYESAYSVALDMRESHELCYDKK